MSAIYPVARNQPDGGPSRYTSAALEGTLGVLIKGPTAPAIVVPARVYKIRVRNNAATAYTAMIFDKATAPVNADVPIWRLNLNNVAGSEAFDDFSIMGLVCSKGIGVAISSTAATLTLAVSADALFEVLYA